MPCAYVEQLLQGIGDGEFRIDHRNDGDFIEPQGLTTNGKLEKGRFQILHPRRRAQVAAYSRKSGR